MLKKHYQVSLFVIFSILINYFGKVVAVRCSLPIWLDSVGTVYTAYLLGPVCGSVVGLTCNLIYGMTSHVSAVYGLTNLAIGLIVGLLSRRGNFESIFGTVSASVAVTVASTVISTPLNLLFFNGYTGNIWGDGVIEYLMERDLNRILCTFIGEFYIDFADKLLTLLLLFFTIRAYRSIRDKKKGDRGAVSLILVFLFSALFFTDKSYANPIYDPEYTNYNAYVQTVYSSNNGLPCGEANDITQSSDGVLWIGTYAGLYRYNGTEFRWMDEFKSVRNVNCLYTDSEGRMWIGTNDNGLSICINEKIVNVVDESDGLPSNSVRDVVKSSDGYYYLGTSGAMQVVELNTGIKLLNTIPEIIYAHSLAADEEGRVAAVTNDGRLFLLKNREVIFSKTLTDDQEIYTCVSFGPDGLMYVGTSAGRIIVVDVTGDGYSQVKIKLCDELNTLNTLFFSEDGTLFACADNGIGYFDSYNFSRINSPSFMNSVDNMCEDYQGNLWFTSSRLGLLRLTRSPFIDVYRATGRGEKVVNSVELWQGSYYVGTDSGLDVLDNELRHPKNTDLSRELEGVRIRCVKSDSAGNLWISTYGRGTMAVHPNGERTIFNSDTGSYGNWARVSLELSDGTVAISSDKGIDLIKDMKPVKTLSAAVDIPEAMVLCLYESADGRLFAGTDGEGIVVIRGGERVRTLDRSDGLTSGVILRMVASKKGGTYIVTSNGLCYMTEEGSIRSLDNFPYYNNYDIWSDNTGRLFVLGSAGIYVINEEELLSGAEDPEVELLDSKSGLTCAITANSWNIKDNLGNLFICGDTGLVILNINDYLNSYRSCHMKLSSMAVDGDRSVVERGEPNYVSREAAKLELFPEIINYTVEDPYVSYMLEGFDTEPTILTQRGMSTVTYTNLPSGEYTFRLCLLDNRKHVIAESSYIVIKEKKIYDNMWFKVYMLIIMAFIVSWFTWYLARLRAQRTLEFQARTLELQSKELELAHRQLQMGNETILAVAKTVDAKDENTSQHSQRVSEYSVYIGERLGFTEEECGNLRNAALLHDIGKIGIPDRILNKPARLDDREYEIMKSHVIKGAEILMDFTLVEHVVEGARYHHERYDGTGYPEGLSGETIPLYGRIIGVADAFDAMTANRVYRKKMKFPLVLEELRKGRGSQFDPRIVDILLELIDDGTIDVRSLYENDPESIGQSTGSEGESRRDEG